MLYICSKVLKLLKIKKVIMIEKFEWLKEVYDLKEANNHLGARALMSYKIGFKQLETVYRGLEACNEIFGYTPMYINVVRSDLDQILYAKLQERVPNYYKIIWSIL